MKSEGLIPVLLSPMTENLGLDLGSLERLISHYVALGIERFWLFGTGGEDWAISSEERLRALQMISTCFPNCFFYVGINMGSVDRSVAFAKSIQRINCEKIALQYMNPYPKSSPLGIENVYRIVSSNTDLPLYAYFSDNFTSDLPGGEISRLADIPGLVGVKYSTSSAAKIAEVRPFLSDEFDVIPAVIKTLTANLGQGFKCSTTVEASLFAPLILNIFEQWETSPIEASREQVALNKSMAMFKTSAAAANYVSIPEHKYVLSKLGVMKPFHSSELIQLTDSDRRHLDSVADTLDLGWYSR